MDFQKSNRNGSLNVLFTCGGTAGHINPAIAVAGRLRELMPGCGIMFVGAEGMMETRRVPESGYEVRTVKITNIQRSLRPDKILHNLRTVKNILTSRQEAKRILRQFKPDVAVGTGGYVCYPVLRACEDLGIPTILHESNAAPGLTTRMLAKRVDRLLLGYRDSLDRYKGRYNVIFTGTPVRREFQDINKTKAELGFDPNLPLVVSVWGSLGSDHMNQIMSACIARLSKDRDFQLIHSAGERGYKSMLSAIGESAGSLKSCGIDVRDYIHDMPLVMAAADLVLCRAGASTLSELAVSGKPAVLVPSPNVTNNHQEKNARVLETAGAAKVMPEGKFDADSLYELVTGLVKDSGALSEMAWKMSELATPGAIDQIVGIILELAT